jgi:hypothetical protein
VPLQTLYAYVDETTYRDSVWGAGALLTEQPIGKDVVSDALKALAKDPDVNSLDTKDSDYRTLSRGYFHTSDDSRNAHSHFARSIVAKVNGLFCFSYESPLQSSDEESAHHLHSVLSLTPITRGKFQIKIMLEKRDSLTKSKADKIVELKYNSLDYSSYHIPAMPSIYSPMEVSLGDKSEPGLQVVDFLLWATNAAIYEKEKKGKAIWVSRLGLEKIYVATWPDGLQRSGSDNLNHGVPQFDEADQHYSHLYPDGIAAPEFNHVSNEEIDEIYFEAERTIHKLANTDLPEHVLHLIGRLKPLSDRLRATDQTGSDDVVEVARTYVRLFDTLPIYKDLAFTKENFNNILKRKKHLAQCLRFELMHGVSLLHHYCRIRRYAFQTNPTILGID